MHKSIFFIIFLILITFVSCLKPNDPVIIDPTYSFVTPGAVFIVNEGNFGWGNGSLTYYSYDSAKIYNDIFRRINQRPLGDVPFSMNINRDFAYIVVNNSAKIEVINRRTLKSETKITGLESPRYLSVVAGNKAYVSSIYSDSVTILNLSRNEISGYININNTSESIIVSGNKAFISNWVGGNEIFVINTETDEVIDSIEVGIEPESMVIDKDGFLWVLCNGGWTRENFAELIRINPQSYDIVKRFIFPSKLNSPLNLVANGDGDTLFYLDNGVRRMSISAADLPSEPFIGASGHLFYKLGINPGNGDIFVTDAVDYQQNGNVLIYGNKGYFLRSYQTGIIPGSIFFIVPSSYVTE